MLSGCFQLIYMYLSVFKTQKISWRQLDLQNAKFYLKQGFFEVLIKNLGTVLF